MSGTLETILNISALLFAFSSMLAIGLSYTVDQILGRLRSPRLVIMGLVGNFVLVPSFAWVVILLIPMNDARATGLFLVATAAGAPFLITLARVAAADLALTSGLLILSLVVTVVYMPLVVPLLVPGVDISALSIALPLLFTMFLPLVIGFVLAGRVAGLNERLQTPLGGISTISLLVLVVATILLYGGEILGVLGSGAVLAVVIFTAGAFGIGYLLGTAGLGVGKEIGLATAQRNIAAATVVATGVIGDPDTIVLVVLASMFGLAVLFPIARLLCDRE